MTLELEHVSKIVGGEAHIQDVSLTCEPGSFNVLLGRTLAGKTTLMRLMAGLDRPSAGRVLMHGQDVTRVPVRRRNVAMVYQQFINYPSLTCFENIASPLKLIKLSRAEIEHRVRREAERLHIEHLLDRLPAELSGGQQQRLAMARALVRDAELLLMDEPLVNLDYKLREALRAEMREIFLARQAVVVYATTDPLEALTLSGNAAVMHEGRIIQYGPTPDVYRQPASVAVAEVFGDPPMNLMAGELYEGGLSLGANPPFRAPAHFADLATGAYRIGIRPAHVQLQARHQRMIALPSEVEVAELAGSETYIHLRHGSSAWVAQQPGTHPYELGEALDVYLDPADLFAFDPGDGRLHAAPPQRGSPGIADTG